MSSRRDTVSRKIEEVYNNPALSRREKAQKKREIEEAEAKKIRNQGQDRGIIKTLVEINQVTLYIYLCNMWWTAFLS